MNFKNKLILKRFLFSALLYIFIFTATGPAFSSQAGDELDFDPGDLKLLKVEYVNSKPFSALIKNVHTGKQFDYFIGDFIGPLEVDKVDKMQVELRHRLSRQKYILALPLDKVEEAAEQSFKDEASLIYDQAALFYKSGDTSQAVELLNKALTKRPDFEDAVFFLGYVYHESGMHKEAYECYTRVSVINPRNYKCFYNMAEILAANRKVNDAVYMLKKSLKIRPDYKNALELYEKITDELDDKKTKAEARPKDNIAGKLEKESLKKALAQYADNIKQLEKALEEAKKKKAETGPIDSELARYKLLYDNNSKLLETELKK